MTKRILAWLLTLAVLFSVVPGVTLGAEAAGASMPGASEFCNHTSHSGWTEWTTAGSLPTAAGNYYLGVDVNLILTGQEAAARIKGLVEQWVCLGGDGLTDEERTAFYATLGKIAANLRENVERGS